MSQALFKCTGNIPVYLKLILLVRESTINKYTHRQGTLWISFIGLLRNCFDYQILLLYNKRQDRHTHPNVPDSSSQLFQILNQAPNLNHHLSIQTWASPMSPISANGQDWTGNHPWHLSLILHIQSNIKLGLYMSSVFLESLFLCPSSLPPWYKLPVLPAWLLSQLNWYLHIVQFSSKWISHCSQSPNFFSLKNLQKLFLG